MLDYKAAGKKVYIRSIDYNDTELIVKWRNQDNVKKYFFYREEFTAEIHRDWMDHKVSTGEVAQFIICVQGTDLPIGSTYLRDIDLSNGIAEYGVFIGEENMRGHGIGKEVLGLTLEYAWKELGLKKVISRAIEGNNASIGSFLSMGFSKDELVKDVPCSDGTTENMVLMSIERK